MANEDANKEVLLMRAKRLQQYCDLLIQQCDNWIAVPNQNISKTKNLLEKLWHTQKQQQEVMDNA